MTDDGDGDGWQVTVVIDDDPIRADVERRLRAILDLALGGPRIVQRAAATCVSRRIDGVRQLAGTPLAVLRSLLDLVAAPAEPTVPAAGIDPDQASEPSAARLAARTTVAADLPIEEYESLAASQVVARLDGLSVADLRRVRRFEVAHRGRRTVLGKIGQLIDA